MTNGLSDNPATLAEALDRPDGASFQQAVNEELASLLEKHAGEKCELPKGKEALPSKLILTIKRNERGSIERYNYCGASTQVHAIYNPLTPLCHVHQA
jgi:hypothetical protein